MGDKVNCDSCGGLGWYYVGPRGETPPEVELPKAKCEVCNGTGKVSERVRK